MVIIETDMPAEILSLEPIIRGGDATFWLQIKVQ